MYRTLALIGLITLSPLLSGPLAAQTPTAVPKTAQEQPDSGQAPTSPPKQEPAISIEITGDQETPLVLYILPWQAPMAPMPDPPQLDDPSLRALTPCELPGSIPATEVTAWQCEERQVP